VQLGRDPAERELVVLGHDEIGGSAGWDQLAVVPGD